MGAACGTAASGCADGSCSVGSAGSKGDCGCDSCAIKRFAGRGFPRLVGGATLPGVQYGAPKTGRAFAQPGWSSAGAASGPRVRPSGDPAPEPWYADTIEQGLHEVGETIREFSQYHTADNSSTDDSSTDGSSDGGSNGQDMDALLDAINDLNPSKSDTAKGEGLTTGEKWAIGGAVVVIGGVIVYEAVNYKGGRRGRRR